MITIKQNDTTRKLSTTLTLDGGTIDPADVSAVHVLMRAEDGTLVTRQLTITSTTQLDVEWDMQSDVGTSGYFQVEWRVTYNDGTKVSVPNDGYERLTIVPVLG